MSETTCFVVFLLAQNNLPAQGFKTPRTFERHKGFNEVPWIQGVIKWYMISAGSGIHEMVIPMKNRWILKGYLAILFQSAPMDCSSYCPCQLLGRFHLHFSKELMKGKDGLVRIYYHDYHQTLDMCSTVPQPIHICKEPEQAWVMFWNLFLYRGLPAANRATIRTLIL